VPAAVTARRRCVVVGAGLAGAVVSRELLDAGWRVTVLERRPHAGGSCWTYDEAGITVHAYGAHIFNTSSERVWRYICRFADMRPYLHSVVAACDGKVYAMPPNMFTFNRLWGVTRPDEARDRLLHDCVPVAAAENVEDYALSVVGRDVYNTLIRRYTEKQWGRSCTELPASVMRRIPVRFTYDCNYFKTAHSGLPVGGYAGIFDRLLSGADVRLGAGDGDIRGTVADAVRDGVAVVWTGSIDEYFDYRFGKLEYRSLMFDHERIDVDDFQGNSVVNHCDAVPYTRTIEHKHFMRGSGQDCPHGYTIVSREYPLAWAEGLDRYYPINDSVNDAVYSRYADLAAASGVVFVGRLGSYRYTTMSDTVELALDLAVRILHGSHMSARQVSGPPALR